MDKKASLPLTSDDIPKDNDASRGCDRLFSIFPHVVQELIPTKFLSAIMASIGAVVQSLTKQP